MRLKELEDEVDGWKEDFASSTAASSSHFSGLKSLILDREVTGGYDRS